jgi:subtilisin family serine protease
MSLGFDFPGMVSGLVTQGWPADLATSVALEAYRANLRMFDAIMEMLRARLPLDGGTVVVAAAGNESRRDVNADYEIAASLPAAADGVIAVGALERTGAGLQVASFSNTLPQVSAPGVAIESAKVGGGLRALSGTSMACPHVAGVATLWWQAVRNQATLGTAPMVVAKILATARTNGFAQGVQVADRGAGVVTSPS